MGISVLIHLMCKGCSAMTTFPTEVIAPRVAVHSVCLWDKGSSEVSCHLGQPSVNAPSTVCVLSLVSSSS